MSGGITPLEVRLPLTEGPGFLEQFSFEVEDDGSIILGVYNQSGNLYAFLRLAPEDFRKHAAFILDAAGATVDADDAIRRGSD